MIGIPSDMDCRKSDKKPLDLLKEARVGVNALADKFGMLASNDDVLRIYAKLDAAIWKLENISEPAKEMFDANDDKPLTASTAAQAFWKMLTDD